MGVRLPRRWEITLWYQYNRGDNLPKKLSLTVGEDPDKRAGSVGLEERKTPVLVNYPNNL